MRFSSYWLRPWYWLLAAGLSGCTDPYLPSVVQAPPSYLVVDGYLNPVGVTTVKLSRTYPIGATTAPPVEAKATLYIEDEAGTRLLLREGTPGTYASTALALNPARRYRLRIYTSAGLDYASDFVPVKITPPIDAVNWRATANGVNITVDAHDPANTSQYYRWETDETWEILPPYSPTVEYVRGAFPLPDIRVPYPRICWGNAHSTTVLLHKTIGLSQDVVQNFRVRALVAPTPLLFSRYSILVQQHALTKEEYEYWELMRKNTESIGSIFDPQPVALTGNVHCLSNSATPALGFVGAHTLTEKRIFISRSQLPQPFPLSNGYETCVPPDTVYLYKPATMPPPLVTVESTFNPTTGNIPISAIIDGDVIGYTTRKRDCVDCRTRGTSTKPSFWP